jgi:hypothetical protein
VCVEVGVADIFEPDGALFVVHVVEGGDADAQVEDPALEFKEGFVGGLGDGGRAGLFGCCAWRGEQHDDLGEALEGGPGISPERGVRREHLEANKGTAVSGAGECAASRA